MSTFKQRISSLVEKTISEFELIAENTPARMSDEKMVSALDKLTKIVELSDSWGEASDELESKSVDDLKAMFNE